METQCPINHPTSSHDMQKVQDDRNFRYFFFFSEKINLSARADIFMINNYYSLEEGFQIIDVTAILMLKCMEST